MTGLLIKIFVCPTILIIASFILPNVHYSSAYQAAIVGLVLALVGHMMEVMLLREDTLVLSAVLDFFASTLIVYFVSAWLPNTTVTFPGAILTAVLLTIAEIPLHRYLVRSGQARKSAI
ncbi:DUF2512 family protein [Fictibacillus sp. Mic-4]|uniref:DUF2512 family protein n=1 Tax=Fictibacillus sp. Mic-4 TaxID=3132826 RepID=UPI003CE9783B